MLMYIIPLNMIILQFYKFKPRQRLGPTANGNSLLKFLDSPLYLHSYFLHLSGTSANSLSLSHLTHHQTLNSLRPKCQYNGFANHEQYYNNNSRMLCAMKLG